MKRAVQITADGSPTISIEEMNVTYHSRHGAIQESVHVFINAGLQFLMQQELKHVSIFEMGFGTGLNALLSLQYAREHGLLLYYYAVEQFPLHKEEWSQLIYEGTSQNDLILLHEAQWNKDVRLNDQVTIHKSDRSLLEAELPQEFDVIYYDAFAPAAQPELWIEAVFSKMLNILKPGGIMVTYCSKADVRRAMIAAGFTVKKIPGPRGKREMLRATKG